MAPADARLVVGLGNPGPEYAATRHNVGFAVVDRLAAARGLRLEPGPVEGLVAVGETPAGPLALLKPLTYMNRSGEAVAPLAARWSLPPERILAVVDDIHLEPGRLRIRGGGSSGGHNGLASLGDALGDEGFARLRIGIGSPPPDADQAEYVLAPFAAGELETMESALDRAAECVNDWLRRGLAYCQETYNAPPPADDQRREE